MYEKLPSEPVVVVELPKLPLPTRVSVTPATGETPSALVRVPVKVTGFGRGWRTTTGDALTSLLLGCGTDAFSVGINSDPDAVAGGVTSTERGLFVDEQGNAFVLAIPDESLVKV
jgi:hypothetical protein